MKLRIPRKGVNSMEHFASQSIAGETVGEYRSPDPHQIEALAYAYDKPKIALFMEMRLGKSLISIRWAKQRIEKSGFIPETVHGKTHRVLITAPLTVLPAWEAELKKEGVKDEDIHYLLGTPAQRLSTSNPLMLDSGWFLINQQGIRTVPELLRHGWFIVIVDESTSIRNPKAEITKLMCKELSNVPNRAILSGLPDPESPMDFFEQFRFLYGGFLGVNNYWAFRLKFFYQGFNSWNWIPKPNTLAYIKNEVHRLAFVLTRKQAKVGSKKIYERRYVPMNPKQRKTYRKVEKEFILELPKGEVSTKWVPVKYSWLSQIAGGFLSSGEMVSEEKMKELLSLIKGELKNDKVVVWFRFNAELEGARKYLSSHGIRCVYISGDVSFERRRKATEDFRNESSIRAMLAQVKCGKFGLDWSVASTAIYYSNSYDMEDRAQSEDRIVHPRKLEPLLYLDLVTKDSVDQDVIEVLKDKYLSSRTFMTRLIDKWKQRRTKC